MKRNLQTFLTTNRAIDAIAGDFGQYGPQPRLFMQIAPLILGNDFKISSVNGRKRVWIRQGGGQAFQPVAVNALGFYLIHTLETRESSPEQLARVCTLVFETVRPGDFEGRCGVWVRDQMDGFACRRCGNCCGGLEHLCDREDVRLWECLGREDILAWVRPEPQSDGKPIYHIWSDPETGAFADICPFLAPLPGKNTFCCTIQKVKPLVCREYPLTRKHARATGCPGFSTV